MNQTSDLRKDAQKDPETLEREIDQTRGQMDQTISALERRLSPGQLVDEALGLFREHGGDFAANLGNSIKQNPLPVMLAAVGIGWMIFLPNQPSSMTNYNNTTDEEGSLAGVGESIISKAADVSEKVKTSTVAARDRLTNSWVSSKDAAMGRVSQTATTAQAQARRAREGFNNLLRDQPIILGALGLALGAAIGGVLPSTEEEDRLLGPTRDKTISQIKERGAEAYERVRETAENAVEGVQRAAEQSGPQSMKNRDESNPERDPAI